MEENAALGVSSLAMLYFSSVDRKLLVPVHCWSHMQPTRAMMPSCWANCPAWTAMKSWSAVAWLGLLGSSLTLSDDRKLLHAPVPNAAKDAARPSMITLRMESRLLGVSGSRAGRRRRSASAAC